MEIKPYNNENAIEEYIQLGGSLQTAKNLHQDNKNVNIITKEGIEPYFFSCYQIEPANAVSKYTYLERYFKEIQEIHPDDYKFVNNMFIEANDYPTFIIELKKKHSEIINEMMKIKAKFNIYYKDFERALSIKNERTLNKTIELMNFTQEITKCYDMINNLKTYSNDYLSIKTGRIAINSSVFGSNASIQIHHSSAEQLKKMKEIKDERERDYKDILTRKQLAEWSHLDLSTKIKKSKESIESLSMLKNKLEVDIKNIDESIDKNDEDKTSLLKELNNPNKHIKYLRDCEAKRAFLEADFLKTIQSVKSEQLDILKEIKNTKVVYKLYHLIFILDESGSMRGSFDAVRNSVYDIIKKRIENTKSDEKVSIIRFDDTAEIDTLNSSIRDYIQIQNMRGGGTSFIEPLKKFEDILQEINCDIYIPIVFFLSDGKGENRNDVCKLCKEIYDRNSKVSYIFFTVGFGEDSDNKTLEEMAKVFNNNKITIKIGNEMIKLFHHASNQEQLKNVFSLYEKLFHYQNMLLKQKTDYLDGFLKNADRNRQKERKMLNDIFEINNKLRNNEKENALKISDDIISSLTNINESLNKKKVEIMARVEKINNSIENLNSDNKEFENELSKITPQLVLNEKEILTAEKLLNDARNNYNAALKDEIDTYNDIVKNAKEFREQNLDAQIKHLEQVLGLKIPKDEVSRKSFINNYNDLQSSYFKFFESKRQIRDGANKLETELDRMVGYLESVNDKIKNCEDVYAPESLADKIWNIIKIFKFGKSFHEKDDESLLFEILLTECRDNEKNRVRKAFFELIFEDKTVSSIFYNLENDESYVKKFLDLSSTKIDNIKELIRNLKREKETYEEELDKKVKQQKEKKKFEDEFKKLEDEIDIYKDYRKEICKITEFMNRLRLVAKEWYLYNNTSVKVKDMFRNINNTNNQINIFNEAKSIKYN